MEFKYPINILCFNRPAYLEQVLRSIQSQRVKINNGSIFFWVDGFNGSKDEMLGRPNRTEETVSMIHKYFPRNQIMLSSENLGIARNYRRAELHSFESLSADSAFFLEDDIVLSPYYLEIILQLDLYFKFDQDISHISATGDVAINISEPENNFQTFGHQWGYLLRGWHHFERKVMLEKYIEIVSQNPYHLRNLNWQEIVDFFLQKGIVVGGTSQDYIKNGLKNYFKRISITTNEPWASNIGVIGEHNESLNSRLLRKIETDRKKFSLVFDPEFKTRLRIDSINSEIQDFWTHLAGSEHMKKERDHLLVERDHLLVERDHLFAERDHLFAERDRILSSKIWKLRKIFDVLKLNK